MGIVDGKSSYAVETPINFASGNTFNSFMADLLYQSIVAGFDSEFKIDSKTKQSTPVERMSKYMEIYGELVPEQKTRVIRYIRNSFETACRKGKINTPYTPQQEQNQIVRGY